MTIYLTFYNSNITKMNKRVLYTVLIFVLYICDYLIYYVADTFNANVGIERAVETTINSGDSLSLDCYFINIHIAWNDPFSKEHCYSETDEEINVINANGIDWSTTEIQCSPNDGKLIITNASIANVRFYNCLRNDAFVNGRPGTSRIINYIFVKDDLFFKVERRNYVYIVDYEFNLYYHDYERKIFKLPCRPTSLDVQVKLYDKYNDEITDQYVYDAKYGFFIETKKLDIKYKCEFHKNNMIQFTEYDINIEIFDNLPRITVTGDRHDKIVKENVVLNCRCNTFKKDLSVNWTVPDESGITAGRIKVYTQRYENYVLSVLNISFSQKSDEGTYICMIDGIENQAKYNLTLLDENDIFIELVEENDEYYRHVDNMTVTKWKINIKSNPRVDKVEWRNNKNEILSNSTKYHIIWNDTESILEIYELDFNDSGEYTLLASNGKTEEILHLFLIVHVSESMEIISNKLHLINKPNEVKCVFKGYYLRQIDMYVDQQRLESYTVKYNPHESNIEFKSEIIYSKPAKLLCRLSNRCYIEIEKASFDYSVTDIENGFNIWGQSIKKQDGRFVLDVSEEDSFQINCGNHKSNSYDFNWYKIINDTPCDEIQNEYNNQLVLIESENSSLISSGYEITHNATKWTNILILNINNVTKNESGCYVCRGNGTNDLLLELNVQEFVPPKFVTETNDTEIKFTTSSPELNCEVNGFPTPEVIWTKDNITLNKQIENNGQSEIIFYKNNSILNFAYISRKDEGEYICKAINKAGEIQKRYKLIFDLSTVKDTDKDYGLGKRYISLIIITVIILVLLMILLIWKLRRESKLKKILREAGLTHFEKGSPDKINSDLNIYDQAEFLPYDSKWEYPPGNLKLGTQLGSGAFGVVVKAEAYGLCDKSPATVAVKMVKRHSEWSDLKALVTELKVMAHLGKHLNIVNLLAACTRNIEKRELLVILEYCPYGNLQKFLLRYRENFINQIDPNTGMVDDTLGDKILEQKSCLSVENANSDGFGATYPQSNIQEDTKDIPKLFCTNDLLSWSFQVACGMDFLSSRKVLHGDLAARNILLSEDNVVKICDFGLARPMFYNNFYKKIEDCPLPMKWMAIESIRDKIFSIKSDVWSFGIVLWEFFSLGSSPYPGLDADETLYQRLINGYRMEIPEYSTKQLYDIMQNCWKDNPDDRPTFTELSETLGSTINHVIKSHYIDLNRAYVLINQETLEEETDYLSLFNSSDNTKYEKTSPGKWKSSSIKHSNITDTSISKSETIKNEIQDKGEI